LLIATLYDATFTPSASLGDSWATALIHSSAPAR